jgi:hypothetical protein
MSSCLKISFDNPIYKNIDTLYFSENYNHIYYDNTHMNYIYVYKEDSSNLEYTFYGFYKDDYFVIIFDSYDNILSINIQTKYVILLKLNWIQKEIKNIILNIIDYDIKNYKIDSIILNTRKKIFGNYNVTIDELLQISKYKKYKTVINSNNNINNNNIILKKIKNFIKSL